MLKKEKEILIDTIVKCIKKKFFIGFFVSLFFSFFYFFLLKNQLHFLDNHRYFFYFLVIFQVFLCLKYFIGIRLSKKNSFIIFSLMFTVAIIAIISIGSLWIFDHLNH
ncbi:hypothetical protein [Buchnera aphidicola]|uniref:hypothetical protein n=1 Tax=Buchnera aphidicola TaxID=9 RepID=UPI00094D9439|nr:hypothetical protein [Buchnera aphidicola]